MLNYCFRLHIAVWLPFPETYTVRSGTDVRFLLRRGLLRNSGGITESYVLSTSILRPRQTDGDSSVVRRLGSRLGSHYTV